MQKITITKSENEIIVLLNDVKETKNYEKVSMSFSLTNDSKITNDNIATFLVTLSTQLTTNDFEYEIIVEPKSDKNNDYVQFIEKLVETYIKTFKTEYEAQLDNFKKQIEKIKNKINEI